MMSESEMDMFDRWTETHDKEEFVRLGLQLFPNQITRKELEEHFEEAMAGYREAEAARSARCDDI